MYQYQYTYISRVQLHYYWNFRLWSIHARCMSLLTRCQTLFFECVKRDGKMIVSDITELLPDSWGPPSRKPITSCVLLKEVMKVIVITVYMHIYRRRTGYICRCEYYFLVYKKSQSCYTCIIMLCTNLRPRIQPLHRQSKKHSRVNQSDSNDQPPALHVRTRTYSSSQDKVKPLSLLYT